MTSTRRSPGVESRAASTPPSDTAKDTADYADFDFDQRIVYEVDESIWRAIYNGQSLGMDGWGRYWMGLASLMLVGAMLVDHLDRRSAAKNLKVRR